MTEPDLLVCDEPISPLHFDPGAGREPARDLQSGCGITYLFISHDLKDRAPVSHDDRRHVSRPHRRAGEPKSLFARPAASLYAARSYRDPCRSPIAATSARERLLLQGDPPISGRRTIELRTFHTRCPSPPNAARDAVADPGRWPPGGLPCIDNRALHRPPDAAVHHLRLLRALTILFVMTFAFVVCDYGDPTLLIMSVDAPPEANQAFRQPGASTGSVEQYASYIGHAFAGDFGKSCATDGRHRPRHRARAATLAYPAGPGARSRLGITTGIYAAVPPTPSQRLTMAVSVAGFTMPSFVLALLLVLYSPSSRWLPASGADLPLHDRPADHHPGAASLSIMVALHAFGSARVLASPTSARHRQRTMNCGA